MLTRRSGPNGTFRDGEGSVMETKLVPAPKITRATYTWHSVDGPLWWRIKMAAALFLSPLTIIFIGRSIRVGAVIPKEEAE